MITNEDEEIYNNLHVCWICKKELDTDKVRGYSKATGKFAGASHSNCSINVSLPKKTTNYIS